MDNIGAFHNWNRVWGILYYTYNKGPPQNPILIIKAPTFCDFKVGVWKVRCDRIGGSRPGALGSRKTQKDPCKFKGPHSRIMKDPCFIAFLKSRGLLIWCLVRFRMHTAYIYTDTSLRYFACLGATLAMGPSLRTISIATKRPPGAPQTTSRTLPDCFAPSAGGIRQLGRFQDHAPNGRIQTDAAARPELPSSFG